MPISSRAEVSDDYPTVQEEVARLSASPELRSAFNWFRAQEPQLAHWQLEMARIAAPPFGESARAAWDLAVGMIEAARATGAIGAIGVFMSSWICAAVNATL